MTFGAAQFSSPPCCRNAGDFYDVIEYTPALAASIPGKHVFWGPYVDLDPGVYVFTLRGSLDGELTFDFACNHGSVSLKSVTLRDLSQPVCLALSEPVKDLELRAVKGSALRLLKLTALSITCAYRAGSDE